MIGESNKTYIHYGSDHFDRELFVPIKNRIAWSKPKGGLWASPIDAGYSWHEWCQNEEFELDRLNVHFKFRLNPGAKILSIRSINDVKGLPRLSYGPEIPSSIFEPVYLDFERLKTVFKIDAVELENVNSLYYEFYTWDCDSIVVLNPDVIEEVMK